MARKNGGARRQRGSGSVKQQRSGAWVARWPRRIDPRQRNIWTGFPLPDGFNGTYPTRAEAEAAVEKAVDAVDSGGLKVDHLSRPDEPKPRNAKTVHDAVREYIDDAPAHGQRGSLGAATVANVESALSRHIDHPDYGIGSVPIAELTQASMYRWWRRMEAGITVRTGDGHTTRRRVYAYVSAALSEQVKKGTLPSNPALGVSLSTGRKSDVDDDDEEVLIPPMSAQWELAHAIPREGDRLFALALMWGGARFSELAGASGDALFPEKTAIRLRHQWKRVKSQTPRKPDWKQERLKTGRRRDMRLPTPLFLAISDWVEHRRPTPPEGHKDVLFPHASPTRTVRAVGVGVWTPEAWGRQVMNDARSAAGLQEFTEKQWRAGVASLWDDAGFRQTDIQRQLGHQPGSQVTALHYLKSLEDQRDEVRERIRLDVSLTPQARLDALFAAWVEQHGDPLSGLPGDPAIPLDAVVPVPPRTAVVAPGDGGEVRVSGKYRAGLPRDNGTVSGGA